jgi:hypothetical protein
MSLVANFILADRLVFLYDLSRLQKRCCRAYPESEQVRRVAHHARLIVGVSVEATAVSCLVLLGVAVSRLPFFDHWDWSLATVLLFACALALVLAPFVDTLLRWRERIRLAKLKASGSLKANNVDDELEWEKFEKIEAVGEWPWDPRGPLRLGATLSAPIILALIQENHLITAIVTSVAGVFD